jgi:hypothetical protein
MKSRPTPEAFGVDVFDLAKKHNYPLSTLKTYYEQVNGYSVVLVE